MGGGALLRRLSIVVGRSSEAKTKVPLARARRRALAGLAVSSQVDGSEKSGDEFGGSGKYKQYQQS